MEVPFCICAYIFCIILPDLAIPLEAGPIFTYNNYMSRIWSWSEILISCMAVIVLFSGFMDRLGSREILIAFVLAIISALSIFALNGSFVNTIFLFIFVFIAFCAGAALSKSLASLNIRAFEGGIKPILSGIIAGILIALPFAALNNIFYYLSYGGYTFENIGVSAFLALNPGISEEVIFRFFIIGFSAYLLRDCMNKKAVFAVVMILAVVPHSLNHLPDIFLQYPVYALVMLAATSLLFGLPMALIQVKRNLETAISFH